eukprot:TRINITY_DN4279_c0_g3_i1.p1 TRINITY_DN4279_c0_g3~~TRINITY_DN4279_c0_g3_i1.p1  ORF type:complete len:237 (-),score=90.04 TRINITY_DN4279_c0_g3_i1:514-1224(-)
MFSCGACSPADPASDTVKVDIGAVIKAPEEHAPVDEEQRRRDELEAERRHLEEEAARLQSLQAEQQKQVEEEEAALRCRQEEEAAARKAEEERLEQERLAAAAAEAARLAQEEAERLQRDREERDRQDKKAAEEGYAAEEARLVQEAADKKKMEEFLKKHSFKGADVKRSSFLRYKFPLHSAVKHNDADMIRILLANGATPSQKDSSGLTAAQLAKKLSKSGSHGDVVEAFAGAVN